MIFTTGSSTEETSCESTLEYAARLWWRTALAVWALGAAGVVLAWCAG